MVPAVFLLACTACTQPAVPIEAACHVVDGDTLRCGEERIRLLGIDAPEMGGHCRPGRTCAPGDPEASKAALSAFFAENAKKSGLTIRRVGEDRYGRTLGVVYAGGTNLSCAQLASGQAIYRCDWDSGGAVREDCPEVAR